MDPKGAEAVLEVFKVGSPDVAKADIDITQTYTNDFAKTADAAVK
jgi:NitT/TauT family transport system substrate-binding protein